MSRHKGPKADEKIVPLLTTRTGGGPPGRFSEASCRPASQVPPSRTLHSDSPGYRSSERTPRATLSSSLTVSARHSITQGSAADRCVPSAAGPPPGACYGFERQLHGGGTQAAGVSSGSRPAGRFHGLAARKQSHGRCCHRGERRS